MERKEAGEGGEEWKESEGGLRVHQIPHKGHAFPVCSMVIPLHVLAASSIRLRVGI